ncbi:MULTISPECIES: ABC transporter permease [unclassified Brevundimonas]|uniref:ABC transporter permease n=1 Tax=unclassified Brevundimonas TaxID=2622653 RepID=UPI003F93060F
MSASLIWLFGLVRRRAGQMLPATLGISLTVALLAILGLFIDSSAATMTRRALGDVPVDWQVEVANGASPDAVEQLLRHDVRARTIEPVGYATVSGFTASGGSTTQTTGEGKVLGVTPSYWADFPGEMRPMLGRLDGVLIGQQTAANLHVGVGDTVSIMRTGLAPVTARIDGVIDLPQADSLFQAVGVVAAAAPQAPPDNVMVVPMATWRQWFGAQSTSPASAARIQFHVRLDHALPPDPGAAFVHVQQLARNFEVRAAGAAVVGDNLAARLDGVREDALYARVLFLFLGLPGAILAVILTFAVSAVGGDRRRREQALLRVRGASTARILRLQSLEALVVSALAAVIALGLVWAVSRWMVDLPLGPRQAVVTGAALGVGVLTALVSVAIPAWREARIPPAQAGRTRVGRAETPFWEQTWIDVILLTLAGVVYWRATASGYQIVLAPEGVAQTSVSYEAFVAPLALWIGVGLLTTRLFRHGLVMGRPLVARLFRPINGSMSPVVAASVSRQARLITRGVVLTTLAFSFAVSTAVFNTTYNVQSNVDAELTNGADVTVTGSTAYPAGRLLADIAKVPGVSAARAMTHRFTYVGNDLQDIYGIDPRTIGDATDLSNAFFGNKDARATMAKLASQRDGALLSQETVNDFQLHVGDVINLRLQSATDHQYHPVPFRFIGVVREFPTAPHDSFVVANADYVAQQTGDAAREVVLIRGRTPPTELAAAVRRAVVSLPGAQVTDLGSVQRTISSSLTAVDLHGLTWIELSFAILLIAGANGLVLGLGLIERRRDFAVLAALGASGKQLGAFLWTEGLIVLVVGMILGTATGFGIAQMLVTMLTGVFDPPPQSLAISWPYLLVLAAAGCLSTVIAVLAALNITRRGTIEALRTI